MLFEETIKDLRRARKELEAGKIPFDTAMARLAYFKEEHNMIRTAIKINILEETSKKAIKRLRTSGVIGNGTVIELSQGALEEEKIYCSHIERNITRSDCLDYSGNADHRDDCKGCDVGLANKNLLLGPPIYTA